MTFLFTLLLWIFDETLIAKDKIFYEVTKIQIIQNYYRKQVFV